MSFTSATPELHAAAERFRAFFEELRSAFVERDDLLTQIALALLGREHVLMTGPPGTAKSGIATAVLGRIVDEKSGKPSLFARQFTESTVQTDLVGPIDFKTLMATGRSEHFTDEGMLGAVHAFLDEVLDGRDMLLRTTLNVLHERELKQGTKTTSGLIECALMTTNRYLAEVLESSRETLLAFVDRIAYVAFVPKGFADPNSMTRVLRTQVGGAAKPLRARLTIQDLDLLQHVVDGVVVSDSALAALSVLVSQLEADLAQTSKADPSFAATRYLSTRTVVRLARVLRSICVYDAIMSGRPAPVVSAKDFASLRLSMVLSGPERAGIAKLVEHEADPRERRQLAIMRTEREAFERALARLPPIEAPKASESVRRDVAVIEQEVRRATAAQDPSSLLTAAAKLAEVASSEDTHGHAARALDEALAQLAARAVQAGTTAGAGPEGQHDDLATLADGLEATSESARPVARWLRGRAMQLTVERAALGTSLGRELEGEAPTDLDGVTRACRTELARLHELHESCARLRAAGADLPDADAFEAKLGRVVASTSDRLIELLDGELRATVARVLAGTAREQLGAVLLALQPSLQLVDSLSEQVAQLGGERLDTRVVGPRVEPLVRAAFQRIEGTDRLAVVEQVGVLVQQLEEMGLKAVMPPADLLRLAMSALVRAERGRVDQVEHPASFEGYRALRAAEQRVSLSYSLVELALRTMPTAPLATASPAELTRALAERVHTLPESLRGEIVALDVARIERATTLLGNWWRTLHPQMQAVQGSDASASALSALAESKYFHVTRDEGALMRFALEARTLGEIFPEAEARVAACRAAVEALESESRLALGALRQVHVEAAWKQVFAAPNE